MEISGSSISSVKKGTKQQVSSKRDVASVSNDLSRPDIKGMQRAKEWSIEVENVFRLQQVGWTDLQEYSKFHAMPKTWPQNHLYSELRVKDTGYYTYWRKYRECPESYLHRVKLYSY